VHPLEHLAQRLKADRATTWRLHKVLVDQFVADAACVTANAASRRVLGPGKYR